MRINCSLAFMILLNWHCNNLLIKCIDGSSVSYVFILRIPTEARFAAQDWLTHLFGLVSRFLVVYALLTWYKLHKVVHNHLHMGHMVILLSCKRSP